MLERFSCYSEVTWEAVPAAKWLGLGGKSAINSDVENFILVRVRDLRKQPIRKNKIMLIGNNETNISIEGPDARLNAIARRLPNYIGKSWSRINKMSLEKDFLNCMNVKTSVCNPQLFDIIEYKPSMQRGKVSESDWIKTDAICANCEKFEPK